MTTTPIHQSVTIMVETKIEIPVPNVPSLISAMTTAKLFDIDYSEVWNRHEYEFQILVALWFQYV